MQISAGAAVVLALVVLTLLVIPYLVIEIKDGKRDFGPLRRLIHGRVRMGPTTPLGTGDNRPGRLGDPAPGQPDGQSDPWSPRAQRR